MTGPEVDQELERLFSVAREASQPHPAARARIRAGLASRLTSTPAAPHLLARPRVWPALGVAAFAVGAAWLWSSGARPGGEALSAAATPRVVQSALPPVPSLPAMPQLEVASPPASASSGAPPSAATTPPAPAPALTAKATSSTSSTLDSAAELQLVRAMQQALRAGNPGRALSLAAEHARRFPRGALSEEREGARAVARCQLAEPGARPAILQAFSHSFGQSPYMARVKAACQ